MIDLTAAGLTPSEAKCYAALLDKKTWKPSDLAKTVNETRTNCYKILDKLVGYGLAERFDQDKKLHYRATHPSQLFQLARSQRTAHDKAEKELELNAQELMATYFKTHEQPGIRFFQGKEGLKEIFLDQVSTNKPIYFLNTIAGIDYYGYDEMHNLRMLAVNNGIPRHALTPDTSLISPDYTKTDPLFLLTRTWLKQDDYTAPVEWGTYGDKTYIISYGADALGMIIESPHIAQAFRQIFALLDRGQRSQAWYHKLPLLAKRKTKVN